MLPLNAILSLHSERLLVPSSSHVVSFNRPRRSFWEEEGFQERICLGNGRLAYRIRGSIRTEDLPRERHGRDVGGIQAERFDSKRNASRSRIPSVSLPPTKDLILARFRKRSFALSLLFSLSLSERFSPSWLHSFQVKIDTIRIYHEFQDPKPPGYHPTPREILLGRGMCLGVCVVGWVEEWERNALADGWREPKRMDGS